MVNNHENTTSKNHTSLTNSKEPTQKIAVLFTDMKGSTTFYKKHGNLAGRIMIQKLNDMLFPIINKHQGVIVKTIGDSIMAYFISPSEALFSAIKMQKKLKEYNSDNPAEDHLLIRTAINYGHGIVERNDVFGNVVNIAGKLIASCDAQQIIISDVLHAKVENSGNISFIPYKMKNIIKELEGLNIFQVDWENSEVPQDTGKLFLLSMLIEETGKDNNYPASIEKILNIIKQGSTKHINIEDSEANVIFTSWKDCIETVKESLRKYLKYAPASGNLPHILRFGLHAVESESLKTISSVKYFSEPIKAREKADPYGIIVTSAFYNSMSSDFKSTCTLQQESPRKLYALHCDDIKKRPCEITNLIPEEALIAENDPCFYCSSTKHLPRQCPSKFIRKKTGYLEKLVYVPNSKLQDIYNKSFISIVQPLESGTDEERFEMLFKENREDLYTKAFFSFYEISEIFQLRSIRQLYTEPNPQIKNRQRPKEILLGEDCLRVSKLVEAEKYFLKAAKEQPDDYRPYIAMGILCIETEKPGEAVKHLKRAISFSADEKLKSYLHLLVTRIYETAGALIHAMEEIKKISRPFSDNRDIIYYSAVLFAKSGETDTAIEIFKSLIQFSSRYYLMVSLNPELGTIQNRITGLLTKEFQTIRDKSNESLEKIKKMLDKYSLSLDTGNEDYKKAVELYQKALRLYREESTAGLLDIQGFEISINDLVSGAVDRAFRLLRRKISNFRKALDDNAAFLSRFPYKNALTQKDYKLQNEFKALINEARLTADAKSSDNLKKTGDLISELKKTSSRIAFNRKRLEITGKAIFIFEFCFKAAVVFLLSAAVTTFIFTSILVLYKIFESSIASALSGEEFTSILKFGICAGIISATFCTGLWIKRKYG